MTDRWIAKDGAVVVIPIRADEILTLQYRRGTWMVARHFALERPTDSRERIEFCGGTYDGKGEWVTEFDETTPAARWEEFYEQCYARPSAAAAAV